MYGSEILLGIATLVLLCARTLLGLLIQPLLTESHRARSTTEIVWVVVGMLATFSSIVLGLLISSQKANFETAHRQRSEFAASLIRADRCFRLYGPEADPIRAIMARYTADSIAATWPFEASPAGVTPGTVSGIPRVGESTQLGSFLNDAELAIRRLRPTDPLHVALASDCLERFQDVIAGRYTMIGEVRPLSVPFYAVMVFWLMVIFTCFGLFAPRNATMLTVIFLCALSLSVAMFVVADLDQPYTGLFHVPSEEMREALAHMRA